MLLSRYIRSTVFMAVLSMAGLLQTAAHAQSAADNIRPVGRVCLAGQPCVGTTAMTAMDVAPVAAATETAAPISEPVEPEPAVPATEAAATAESDFDAAAAYQASCFACHGSDALGAPQPGDAAAWEERMAKGMDRVMTNVINGFNTMPARGICMTCSDDDLRSIVDYMLAQ